MTVTIMIGDVREQLRKLPDDSVHCVVTSPPYWALRDYGVEGQIGLEATPAEFIATMVDVFEEVRRVLRPDGTCWVNMGDSYAGGGNGGGGSFANDGIRAAKPGTDKNVAARTGDRGANSGLKPKDLCMMPHRLAIALQDAGWWVRQDICWSKPNPMPESVRDRCTKAHEYIFLLSKSERYYYDADAIREPVVGDPDHPRNRFDTKDYEVPGQKPQKRLSRAPGNVNPPKGQAAFEAGDERHRTKAGLLAYAQKQRGVGFGHGTDAQARGRGRVTKQQIPSGWATGTDRKHDELAGNFSQSRTLTNGKHSKLDEQSPGRRMVENVARARAESGSHDAMFGATRNKRSVWTMATHSFKEAHFATFPPELPETCIKAGTSEAGCCSECGTQWVRDTEVSYVNPGNRTTNGPRSTERRHETAGFDLRLERVTKTLGWRQACKCPSSDPVPTTVLDPFFGAGTTGLVADRLQRNCIGIELNPVYAEMARKRIQAESPLLSDVRIAA